MLLISSRRGNSMAAATASIITLANLARPTKMQSRLGSQRGTETNCDTAIRGELGFDGMGAVGRAMIAKWRFTLRERLRAKQMWMERQRPQRRRRHLV
jgi:hypothetical protein